MCIKSWIRVAGLSLLLVAACPSAGLAQNAPTNQPSKNLTLDLGGGVTMELVLIQPGSFPMGSKQPNTEESPVHKVTISKPFYMGKYTVTQKQWKAVMGSNISYFKGPDNPADGVSWDDCQAFLRKLGEKVGGGRTFTLPTEAQWEYACRAGTTGKYCYGDDEAGLGEYAWFHGNSGDKTHPVGQKKPNAWGLYDMHGNVMEWCLDRCGTGVPYDAAPQTDPVGPATGPWRILRGGSWTRTPADCRSAYRHGDPAYRRDYNIGCRVVCGPAAVLGPSKLGGVQPATRLFNCDFNWARWPNGKVRPSMPEDWAEVDAQRYFDWHREFGNNVMYCQVKKAHPSATSGAGTTLVYPQHLSHLVPPFFTNESTPMTPFRLLTCAALLLPGGQLLSAARAEGPAKAAVRPLLDVSAAGVEKRLVPDYNCQDIASFARSQDPAHPGLVITFQPGPQGSPGACLKPRGAPAFDLSAFGHVEARVVNTGTKTSAFFLRVDNEGDWHNAPWSTEKTYVQPGASARVKVIFGYQYGYHPGYALNPAAVVNILMFTDKSDVVQSFRVESLVAGGPAGETPPVDPASLRIPSKNGFLLGPGAALDAKPQIEAKGTQAAAAADGQSLEVFFPDAKGEQSVAVKPPVGRWDLRNATEVRVKLKNEGQTPITPNVQVTSNGGQTDLVTAAAPLAAGEETQLVASFLAAVPGKGVRVLKAGYYGNQPGTGTSFASDATDAVRITAKHAGQAKLLVESITAAAPPAVLPDWLGKRPPPASLPSRSGEPSPAGDWVKTFDDEFDGTSIDSTKWNVYGPNYWDKTSHWSKDDVIVGSGVARLRYERKRGYHNDDPHPQKGAYIASTSSGSNESNYAAGFLETYGKWVQRYGYFEARMKLPTAPGLWPAFWMAPDRGVQAGPQWKRQDTGNGGTELDIMEHLTRWGRYRYNIAMHLDGYGKEHIAVGSDKIYVEADKDGFITCGLLWTPGSTIYYCNGKEVFRWESPKVSRVPSDMMLTIPMGGWDNNALDDKQLPADFVIDYVRVWQRKDLASSADGYQPAPKPEKK